MESHNKDYDLAILVPGNIFYKDFVTSFGETLLWLTQNNYKFIYRIWSSSNLPNLRNSLIGSINQTDYEIYKTPFGGRFSVNKILLIDSDTSWTISDLDLIINSNKDIITGIVSIGEDKYSISKRVLGNEPWGYYTPYSEKKIPKNEIFEVDACGSAFMCIKSDVFENIDFPWFDFKQTVVSGNMQPNSLSEDYYFCENLKSKGYKIYADSRVRPGHLKIKPLY